MGGDGVSASSSGVDLHRSRASPHSHQPWLSADRHRLQRVSAGALTVAARFGADATVDMHRLMSLAFEPQTRHAVTQASNNVRMISSLDPVRRLATDAVTAHTYA